MSWNIGMNIGIWNAQVGFLLRKLCPWKFGGMIVEGGLVRSTLYEIYRFGLCCKCKFKCKCNLAVE